MVVTGRILQLILNWRSQKYAGSYRHSAVLRLVLAVLALASFLPSLMGKMQVRRALSAEDILQLLLSIVAAWQAVTLPSVPHVSEEDHVE